MSNLPLDTRAQRQEIYAGFIAFVLGFFGVLVTSEWLITHFVEPDTTWLEILHNCISAIFASVLGGLALAALAVNGLSRYHYWRGVYRCRFCGRPLRGFGIHCDCSESQAFRRYYHDA